VALLAGVIVAVTGCPPDETPPGGVTGLTATPGDAQVELNWTNPTDEDFAGVRIVRRTGQAPSSPTDGTVVYAGTGQTFLDTGLDNGTTYYYAAYAYDEVPNYAAAAHASGLPTAATAVVAILTEYEGLQVEIADIPDAVLGPADRDDLTELVRESELLYRAGDDCGAAMGIIGAAGVLAKIQEFRQVVMEAKNGEAVETMEELYNRSRMVRYDMLAGLPAKNQCPGQERVGFVAEAEVGEEDNTKLLALAELGEPRVLTAEEEEEGLFTQVVVPGADSKLGEPGMPGVPMFRRLIAAPIGSEPMLTGPVQKQAAESIFLNLYPYQEEPIDQPDDEVFADPPFVMNDEVYAEDAWYPPDDELVKLTYLGDMRDVQMFLVEVAGGQYNPVTNELRLFADHDVDVDFQGGEGGFITEASDHAFESAAAVYQGAVLNKASIAKYVVAYPGPFVLSGEELLIMTHPDFLAAANDLATFKRSIGISTRVVQCGTGSPFTDRDTNTEIDDWIEDHYDEVFVRPSYILLFGDAEFIAPFYLGNIGTDWPYAILGTPGSDNIPDFAVGRIPVDTLAQANAVVNKIIDYEDTPPWTASFYGNATLASQFQCCRETVPQDGTAQRTFTEVSEFCRNVMMTNGKTVDRFYEQTNDSDYTILGRDTTPRRYFDGTPLPFALGPFGTYNWSVSAATLNTNLMNAWDAGRFLIIHRDHGWHGGWGHPPLTSSDLSSLANGELQPVVFSVNCASGFFDNETAPAASIPWYWSPVSDTGTYFCERLLRDPLNGAVGILGDTRDSPSWANTALLKGFMDAIWPSALPAYGPATSQRRLGDILNHGKLYMWTQIGTTYIYTSTAQDELRLWHVLGDPTLEIWTSYPWMIAEPIQIPEYIPKWKPQLGEVHVIYPEEGALITVLQQDRELQIPVPIARGVVQDGVAKINVVKEPTEGLGFEVSASVEGRVGAFASFPAPEM